jgi:hypothetical protein
MITDFMTQGCNFSDDAFIVTLRHSGVRP